MQARTSAIFFFLRKKTVVFVSETGLRSNFPWPLALGFPRGRTPRNKEMGPSRVNGKNNNSDICKI